MANVSVNEKQGTPESAPMREFNMAAIEAAARRNHKAVSAHDEASTLAGHALAVLKCISVAAASGEDLADDYGEACEAVHCMLTEINTNLNTLFSEWQKQAAALGNTSPKA